VIVFLLYTITDRESMLIIDNEIPLASTVRFVQGVYFALKRRCLNIIKALPSFWFLRVKTRENG
ncbi:MAG: hypothetical protein IJM62_05060, partial [Lachnospiraceae bacterium]|nr:hypothetical protein [Lachnospiraceae bacterium]